MTAVCDFINQSINLNDVAAHFQGIIGYVSDYPSKNLTQANFNRALQLGLTVGLVCEQAQQQAQRGSLGGMHDSTIANQQANALGYDQHAVLWYIAEDPSRIPTSEWPTVVEYFQALPWGGTRPRGAYGGLDLVTHLLQLGLVTYGWVVSSWGGINGLVHLEQAVGANTFGLPIDVDIVLQADYGSMPRPVVPPVIPVPPPTQESRSDGTMMHDITIPTTPAGQSNAGCGWEQTTIPWTDFLSIAVGGSAPGRDNGYWPGSAQVNETNGQVLVTITGANPGTNVLVHINATS